MPLQKHTGLIIIEGHWDRYLSPTPWCEEFAHCLRICRETHFLHVTSPIDITYHRSILLISRQPGTEQLQMFSGLVKKLSQMLARSSR
jgi:hypothetical protein